MSKWLLRLFILWEYIGLVSGQTTTFDAREATIESVHHSLYNGLNSCHDVVTSFLARIAALNHQINAIISLNPNTLNEATALDQQLSVGNATGSLFCIPILLKDNFDTANMPTTGGSLALSSSQPTLNAPAVTALKKAGAIILGKANLQELALEGLSVSSLGGQTINPYDFTRTPGGSSGGSGAAVAASFSVLSTGTDTVNSLRSPASANSLFSIRPTRGLISRAGVIPISFTQDALGVIARSVGDVAIALTVMARVGFDAEDNATALIPYSLMNIDYAANLSPMPLKGVTLGVLATFFNRTATPETTPVNVVMDSFLARLKAAGATLVPITNPVYNIAQILAQYDTQQYEYRESMNAYLQRQGLEGTHPQTLNELYAPKSSGDVGQFLVIPAQYEHVNTALVSSTSNTTYATVRSGIRNLTSALQDTFKIHSLNAIVYPEQRNLVVRIGSPSQSGRNGILAAVTGSPVVTVPVGFSNASETAPVGVPIGMEILGRPWDEQKLLGIARTIEMLGTVRKPPVWAREVVDVGNLTTVPDVRPDRGNILADYPVGVL
jgi:Asp-tRNA(Asn)/Glu-tRNA(Gln) amidotransferase A subunit family amidase